MKTCKDCIYFFSVENDYAEECRLYPEPVETNEDYWCGQFKPAEVQETVRATYHQSGERLIRLVRKPGSTVTRQYSDDDGKTWSAPEEILKETITTKDVEPLSEDKRYTNDATRTIFEHTK